MFLIDYEGCTGQWQLSLVEKLDISWKPKTPIKSPRLESFTHEDLESWIENQYKDLPNNLTNVVDDVVESILQETDDGIPERVMEELCDYCGWDWYEVCDQWLTL